MSIVWFLIFVFLGGFLVFAAVAWHVWRRIHDTVGQFRRQMDGFSGQQGSTTPPPHSTRTPSGDTITDTRSEQQANRKIFAKDEGEYVDFVEKP